MPDHDKVLEIIRLKSKAPAPADPGAAALLVIDVQRYFVARDESFVRVVEALAPGVSDGYCARVRDRVLPNLRRLLAECRALGVPIIYTGTGTRCGDGSDLAGWLQGFDAISAQLLGDRVWPPVDAPSWRIDEAVAPRPGEAVLQKTTADPFVSTDLDATLRAKGVRTVIVTGLTTDVCVAATARAAADRSYETIVVEDACTTLSEELHRASLQIIGLAFGRVLDAASTIELLRAGTPEPSAGPVLASG